MKPMNIVVAIVAGLVGTAVISLLMAMGSIMGMPKMAIWEMLGTMFDPQGNTALGWVMHSMTGTVFAVVYAVLWSVGLGAPTLLWGALFGAVHFLLVGAMTLAPARSAGVGAMPMMHAGIRAGTVQAPGVLMLNNGVMGFMSGLIGHIVFGLVVAAIYAPLAS
jgi:hypothetical protein